MKVDKYAKAIVAALAAAYALYQTARGAGSDGGEVITVAEWVNIAVAGLTAGGVVYFVPNAPKPPAVPPKPDTWTDPEPKL